jgi:hypothetical protein
MWCVCKVKATKQDKPIIGEVCLQNTGSMNYGKLPAHQIISDYSYFIWEQFTADQYEPRKNHDGFLCISGRFHKPENVIFYDEFLYGEHRKKVEARLTKQRLNSNK